MMILLICKASIAKAYVFWRLGRIDEGLNLLDSITSELNKLFNQQETTNDQNKDIKVLKADFLNIKGNFVLNKNEFDTALDYYMQSLALYKELGKKNMKIARAFNNLGIIYTHKSNLDLALGLL